MRFLLEVKKHENVEDGESSSFPNQFESLANSLQETNDGRKTFVRHKT